MHHLSTSGILLRRTECGEYDLIVTLLTLAYGKVSMIAKYARKSRKRFPGTLELFSEIGFVGVLPSKGGLPIIQEAWLKDPFPGIRANLQKTAYASYWSELLLAWLEEGRAQKQVYQLLRHCLESLDKGESPAVTSIVFQLYFLKISGLSPNFSECSRCRTALESMKGERYGFDLATGGLICQGCLSKEPLKNPLSRGTIKQLVWMQARPLKQAARLRFSEIAAREGLLFLEAFVPYHLGREPKSLKFLNRMRLKKA